MELAARTSFARIEGVGIHWLEVGEAIAGPPVVLLHGLNDCHLTWDPVVSRLSHDHRVFVPDLPGHGLSDRPDASYRLHWYARIMARWIEAIGFEEVDIVGHSFGGGVGQVMLLECRERIRRLALVSSGGLGKEITFLLRLASLPVVIERCGQPFMSIGTRLALQSASKMISHDHIMKISEMNAETGSARAFARTVRDLVDWRGQRHTFYQRAHRVTRLPPIAVFWGMRDNVIPAEHATTFAQFTDGARVRLSETAGHYLHHDEPEWFARELRQFLDDPFVGAACLRLGETVDRIRGEREGIQSVSIVNGPTDAPRKEAKGAWNRVAGLIDQLKARMSERST